MPSTCIEVRRQYPAADEVAIIDAIQDALIAAFRIPPADKHVRLVVHEPQPEFYTLVTMRRPDLSALGVAMAAAYADRSASAARSAP